MPESRPEDSRTEDNELSSLPDESTGIDGQISAESEAELQSFREDRRPKSQEVFGLSIAFQGPIPHPSVLAGYDNVVPGSADRIIAMAERQSAHRQSMESKVLEADIEDRKAGRTERRFGQFFGFGIGTIAIVAGATMTVMGEPLVGGLLGGGAVVALVSVFVYGRKTAAKESEEETDES